MEETSIDVSRKFHSRLNSLALDLKCEIGEVPLQKGMRPTSRKKKVIELLNDYHVKFTEIGTGTNRFIVKYDGFALKIGLDHEGVADNMQEFAICNSLNKVKRGSAAEAYEISSGGHLLTAEYCPALTSYNEMWSYHSEIENILTDWSKLFLLGDVGITRQNYANWGISQETGKIKCIDYAYIFPSSMDLFKCICGNTSMTFAKRDFSSYKCTKCGKEYADRELRAKISTAERMRLFNNVKGIRMTEEYEMHPVDPKYIKINTNPDMPSPYCGVIEDIERMRRQMPFLY
jgi:hypothetical protein